MESSVKTSAEIKTPDQMLGESIVKKLIEAGYIEPNASKTFLAKFSSGKLKESDWRVEFSSVLNTVKS